MEIAKKRILYTFIGESDIDWWHAFDLEDPLDTKKGEMSHLSHLIQEENVF